jgi:hypothetical protein
MLCKTAFEMLFIESSWEKEVRQKSMLECRKAILLPGEHIRFREEFSQLVKLGYLHRFPSLRLYLSSHPEYQHVYVVNQVIFYMVLN